MKFRTQALFFKSKIDPAKKRRTLLNFTGNACFGNKKFKEYFIFTDLDCFKMEIETVRRGCVD